MLRAGPNTLGSFLDGFRKDHRIRRLRLVMRRVFCMLGEDVLGLRKPVANEAAQSLDTLGGARSSCVRVGSHDLFRKGVEFLKLSPE